MKHNTTSGVIGVVGILMVITLVGLYRFNITNGRDTLQPPEASVMPGMSEIEAKAIAEASCIKGGEALGSGSYNSNSNTWWFDANLNTTRPGCSPACVVFEETKTTEINWRCTGAIPPQETVDVPDAGEPAVTEALTGKTWVLIDARRADGTVFVPKQAGVFTLTFDEAGTVGIGTDCNSMGGGYTVSGSSLAFGVLMSTMMYCDGSEESVFSGLLSIVSSYRFTDSGELVLEHTSQEVRLRFK